MRFNLPDAQQALGFVVSQTSYIEQQVVAIQYPDIQYPELIPVDTSATVAVGSDALRKMRICSASKIASKAFAVSMIACPGLSPSPNTPPMPSTRP